MTAYDECLTVVLRDGRVIICQANGYRVRTMDSAFGHDCIDGDHNNYGSVYWKKDAMKSLGIKLEDIVMQCKGRVSFTH